GAACHGLRVPIYSSFRKASIPVSSSKLFINWSRLTDIVSGKATVHMEKQGVLSHEHIEAFIGAMHVVGSKTAPQVAAVINPGRARRFLDVGGASGTYTLAFLAAAPKLKATLYDLPQVVEMARKRISNAGMAHRVTFVSGDFNNDPLPHGTRPRSSVGYYSSEQSETEQQPLRKDFPGLGAGWADRDSRLCHVAGSNRASEWSPVCGKHADRHCRGEYLYF
ncbi:MAG: methyltransferase, partial [Dissulfuribacterales bacterium]